MLNQIEHISVILDCHNQINVIFTLIQPNNKQPMHYKPPHYMAYVSGIINVNECQT